MQAYSRLWALAGALLMLAACPPAERPELPKPQCVHNSDCPAPQVCAPGGVCADMCKVDRDCAAPLVCIDASCQPPPGRCLVDAHCGAEQICGAGGTCAMRCSASSECGIGAACVSGACLPLSAPAPQCVRNSDCESDRVCAAGGVCTEACTLDRDCPARLLCKNAECVPPSGRCLTDAHCLAGQLCGAGLTCATKCGSNADCPGGYACIGGGCLTVDTPMCVRSSDCAGAQACVGGTCALACVGDKDCATGAECLTASGVCALTAPECERNFDCNTDLACIAGSCTTACLDNRDCAPGAVCELPAGRCIVPAPECVHNHDCNTDQSCVGGSCTEACEQSRDCPPGALCTTEKQCVIVGAECVSALDCDGPSETCSAAGLCVPTCLSDGECAAGRVCSNGGCVESGPSTATIAGLAQLTGLSTHKGILVKLRGPGNADVVTPDAGAYSFAGLPPGRYAVTLVGPSTREGTLQYDVLAAAGTTTNVDTAVFTPVGSVAGLAQLGGASYHAGIQVFASGTAVGGVTDSDGNYLLRGLVPGAHLLVATFPGYDAASVEATAVYATTRPADPMTLPGLAPANVGDTFVFVGSPPPARVRTGHAYDYTARAMLGASTFAQRYELAAGPPTMTISTGGRVNYKPTASEVYYTYIVAIRAVLGTASIYQVYELAVDPGYEDLVYDGCLGLEGDSDVSWSVHQGADDYLVRRTDTSTDEFHTELEEYAGRVSSLRVQNGGEVTESFFPSGTIARVSGSFGRVRARYPGGVVGAVEGLAGRVLTLGSAPRADGGMAGVVEPLHPNQVLSYSYQSGIADGFTDFRDLYPRGAANRAFMALTEVLTSTANPSRWLIVTTATTGDTLSDATANWTPDSLTELCLTGDTTSGTDIWPIVTNTDREIQVNTTTRAGPVVALSAKFSTGDRYYIVRCADGKGLYTVEDTDAGFVPGALAGLSADLWRPATTSNGTFTIESNSEAGFQFYGPVGSYANLILTNFYLAGTSSGYPLRMTDAQARLPAGLADGTNQLWLSASLKLGGLIIDNTETSITFALPFRDTDTRNMNLSSYPPGLYWAVGNATAYLVKVELATAGYLDDELAGLYLYVEGSGDRYLIVSNTTSSVTLQIGESGFPGLFSLWGEVATATANDVGPTMLLHDTAGGLVPDAWINYRVASSTLYAYGKILDNDDDTLTFYSECSYCDDLIRVAKTGLAGKRYLFAHTTGGNHAHVRAALESPVLVPGELANREVVVEKDPDTTAKVKENDASSVVLDVDASELYPIEQMVAGDRLIIYAAKSPYGASSYYRVTVVDQAAADGATFLVPGAWIEYSLVDWSGTVVGTVIDNDTTSYTLAVSSLAYVDGLVPGTPYALAGPPRLGRCTPTVGWIDVTVALEGASLVQGAYEWLYSGKWGRGDMEVFSSDTSEAHLKVCPSDFYGLPKAQGTMGYLHTAGYITVQIEDAGTGFWSQPGAPFPPSLIGYSPVQVPILSKAPAVISSTSSTLTLSAGVYDWDNLYSSKFTPGATYTLASPAGLVPVIYLVRPASFGGEARPMVPRSLESRRVVFFNGLSYRRRAFQLATNDAAGIIVMQDYDDLDDYAGAGMAPWNLVTTSRGAVLVLEDTDAHFPEDRLVGRTLLLSSESLIITANNATQLVAVSRPDEVRYSYDDDLAEDDIDETRGATTYRIDGPALRGPVLPLPGGGALAAAYAEFDNDEPPNDLLWRIGSAGPVGFHSWVSTATPLSVTPLPIQYGVVDSSVETLPYFTIRDAEASWVPGSLVGQRLSMYVGFDLERTILDNGTDTITTLGNPSPSNLKGRAYTIDPFALRVAGTTLTEGALQGKVLLINGSEFVVRSNSQTEIALVDPRMRINQPAVVDPAGGTAYVLDGLAGDRINDVVSDGASGFYVAGEHGLAHFDGARWHRFAERETAGPPVKSGVVTRMLANNQFEDTEASFGDLTGKRVLTPVGALDIIGSTATTIITWPVLAVDLLARGDRYTIIEANGIDGDTIEYDYGSTIRGRDTEVWTAAADGGVVWVGTGGKGLYRLDVAGGTWSRITVALTASGLPSDDVRTLGAGGGELWVAPSYAPIAQYNGSVWTQYWPDPTGLPGGSVNTIKVRPPAVWFSTTGSGHAMLEGGVWTRYGNPEGFPYRGRGIMPDGDLVLCDSLRGLLRVF